jgi:hypothetical protein
MNDLLIGVIIIGLLSAILLLSALRIAPRLTVRTSNLLAIIVVALMIADATIMRGSIMLTRWLPFSNLIVLGNFSPLLAATFLGLVFHRLQGTLARRIAVAGTLALVCLLAVYKPIISPTPKLSDRWERDICLQTSSASCSPAAAATLLRQFDIKTDEREMAMLCLTSDAGTSMHGLWRGLKLKASERNLDVYMFEDATVNDLRGVGPVLLSVELEPNAKVDPRYASVWGWMPGVAHTVVLLSFPTPFHVLIADPATGVELWTITDLNILWHGVGARLIPSNDASALPARRTVSLTASN